ncbi:MAG: hypothetical protein JSV68_20740, partial [Anaerolineaceae bacterium]
PPEWEPDNFVCRCSPRMQIDGAIQPFAERMVFIGDSGVSRLYKDGLGAAYRTAKAASRTAIFHGIGRDDFRDHFWPVCRTIAQDNRIGKLIFAASRQLQKRRFARRALLQMLVGEQRKPAGRRSTSAVLWDTFTGSASYRDVLQRTLQPAHLLGFTGHIALSAMTGDDRWNRLSKRRHSPRSA